MLKDLFGMAEIHPAVKSSLLYLSQKHDRLGREKLLRALEQERRAEERYRGRRLPLCKERANAA